MTFWLDDPAGLTARGFCLLWQPGLVWTNAASDLVTGLAYLTVSLALGTLAWRRPGAGSVPLLALAAGFSTLCGLSHWLDVLTLWVPTYGIQAIVKILTAIAAFAAAAALLRLLPQAMAALTQYSEAMAALSNNEEMLGRIDAAQRGRDRFRAAIQAVQGVLWTNDATGRLVGEQPAWAALTGQTFDEYQGFGWANAVHPEDAGPTVQAWNQAVAERRTFVFEHRVRRHDGAWRTFAIRAEPLLAPDHDTILEWVGVHTDITEQRQAEAALQNSNIDLEKRVNARTAQLERMTRHLANARDRAEKASRAKSRFLAGMSHELRTPLTGILGYAEMLRMEGGLNTTQEARLNAMLGAGNHLLQMISCVLDLSEIEAEHVELHPVQLDVQAVAMACLDLIRPLAEAKSLTLSIALAPGTSPNLVADPTRLRQVLLNLLSNAAKFTSQGAISVRMRAVADIPAFRIEFADTGVTIPAGQRQRLFQEFERLETEQSHATDGAGLGLALSARLAALMGGRIGYDENPGGGNVFWLELPFNVTAASAQPPAPATPIPEVSEQDVPPASWPPRPLDVLVVDDVFMNRDIAKSFLQAAGHNVTCVEDGADAVPLAASTDFDLIFMDVRMPRMDGLEATRHIRALNGTRGQVPIVALTAHAFADQVEACREAGMDSHLAKPFDMTSLLAAVQRAGNHTQRRVPQPGPIDAGHSSTAPLGYQQVPVLNQVAFKQATRFLPPDVVATHLHSIARLAKTLLNDLQVPDALTRTGADLAEAAHSLAGSAGMFGFERLAATGRGFERAMQSGIIGEPAIANQLRAAVEATLEQIPNT